MTSWAIVKEFEENKLYKCLELLYSYLHKGESNLKTVIALVALILPPGQCQMQFQR